MMPLSDRLSSYRQALLALQREQFKLQFPSPAPSCEEAQFEEELQGLARWLEARFTEFSCLQELTTEIIQGSLLEEVLARIYDAFERIIPYDRIGCALLSDDGQQVRSYWARSRNQSEPLLKAGFTARLAGSSLEPILHSHQPRIINNLADYLHQHPESTATRLILQEGILSSLTCPLIAEGKAIGFLFFSSCQIGTYQALHQRIFLNIARQVSLLIEKSHLYQQVHELNQQLMQALAQLKEQSCRDALTGLLNRGAIMEFLTKMQAESERTSTPCAVIMADVDHFKQINDSHGHPAGDRVLQAVAQTLREQVREYDAVGRYGGEEFLILLRGSDHHTAGLIAERIRHAIAALALQTATGQPLPVTISLGVAMCDPKAPDNTERLLSAADTALYQAKRHGRNRVCSYHAGDAHR